jgi:homogentisate 1,2-dioxygenase
VFTAGECSNNVFQGTGSVRPGATLRYVAGNFMSRRGVEIASFTLHPAGIPHGPHPSTVEASIGKEATEELAVMVDTFDPLHVTRAAMDLDDGNYPYSWLPAEDHAKEASELAQRGRRHSPNEHG